ncbi:DNA internalization-related competence protein ComEC/Rec2 [Bacillus sp. B15-48]|uniref:DNA internalization-related competence protein ComEC/Rec2 n=1 Tax=Bacillus sp. B15-48 TaxID=1548601 RepID=UPI00193F06C6|nr:DNA internalization-related competence protein ComEC/Rec2 [Bacillus sp. B15-48]MBM4762358.1 DNA internalization-related competence protein ComEC/Rec2 [Bacillus sp. B15-48]
MRGNCIYVAIIAILALLTVFENAFAFSFVFLAFYLILFIYKKFTYRQLSFFLIVYLFFIHVANLSEGAQESVFSGKETSFTIRIIDEVKFDGDRLSALVEILPEREKAMLSYRIRSSQEKVSLKETIYPGTKIFLAGSLKQPGQSRNPNGFNYQQYLQRKNIYWMLEPEEIDLNRISHGKRNILTILRTYRQKEVQTFADHLEEETAAIFSALLFGDRQLMSPETKDSYTKNGTVHLLAISGLHVGLLTGMVFYLLLFFGVTKEKAELSLIILLPLYAILTGLAPSVMRAATMLLIFLLLRRWKLRIPPIDILSITCLLLITLSPMIIYEPGFQLSFFVSLALILSAGRIICRFSSYLSRIAVVSIISHLTSIPIIINYFYEISLIAVVSNLLFVPLFSIILLPLILVVYFIQLVFPFALDLLLPLITKLILLTNTFSYSFASLPMSSLIIGKPASVQLFIYIVTLVVTFIWWEKKYFSHSKLLFLFVLPFLPIFIQLVSPYLSPYGKIVFVDVGQGDSILIQLPYQRGTYVIDTGGTITFNREDWQSRRDAYEVGKDVLVPYLKSEGIRKIDKLILTHGDMDHIGGAIALISELKIKEIMLPVASERSEKEIEILEMAMRKKIKVEIVGKGHGWYVEDNRFLVLSPMEELSKKNDGSIVIWAQVGGKTWLFTGDLEQSGEEQLITVFRDLKVDFLKVGHHGSNSSTSQLFLDTILPEVAVITVGRGNRYGHPHKDVLERLEEGNVEIYRTDQNGAILYLFKGKNGTFRTWIP